MKNPALIGMLVMLVSVNAWACTCRQPSVEDAKRTADVIFAGRVEEVVLVDSAGNWEPRVIVRFSVARVWKGAVDASFTMHSSFESSSCAGFFREFLEPGTSLLVYGRALPGKVWKRNGQVGAPNADSYTLLHEKNAPERRDLLDAVGDDATVYTTDICTRTRPVAHAAEDFAALGESREIGPSLPKAEKPTATP